MTECDVSADRAWRDQYYCGMHGVWFRDDEYPSLCPAGHAVVQATERAEHAGWIPVSERLPERGTLCLVTMVLSGTGDPERRTVTGMSIIKSDGLWDVVLAAVIAWQPLPGPYRGAP